MKWPFWLETLQLNAHQQSALFANLTILPFCSASMRTLTNTMCTAFTLALHSVNKQKNNERYSKLVFFQCSENKPIYSLFSLVLTLFCPLWLYCSIATELLESTFLRQCSVLLRRKLMWSELKYHGENTWQDKNTFDAVVTSSSTYSNMCLTFPANLRGHHHQCVLCFRTKQRNRGPNYTSTRRIQ